MWYQVSKQNKSLKKVRLGNTDLKVSLMGLGGGGILTREDKEKESMQVLERAKKLGINYLDTAWSYGDGISEKRIGKFIKNQREDFVIATKTPSRNYNTAKKQIEESLDRLKIDYVDLLQVHHVENVEDWNKAKNTTLKAVIEAQEKGLAKYVGVTGHAHPQSLINAVREYDFDVILMSLNAADIHYKSFQKRLLPLCVERNIGIIAMKLLAYGNIFNPDGITTIQEAFDYVYSLPIDISIVGVDNVKQLEENVNAVRFLSQLSKKEMQNLEDLTKKYYQYILFFREGLEKYNLYW